MTRTCDYVTLTERLPRPVSCGRGPAEGGLWACLQLQQETGRRPTDGVSNTALARDTGCVVARGTVPPPWTWTGEDGPGSLCPQTWDGRRHVLWGGLPLRADPAGTLHPRGHGQVLYGPSVTC